ncbi:MAG: Bug family tripartite tricarboxylate transporter substrate binding protein [Beijerinckiaceae bacterium]
MAIEAPGKAGMKFERNLNAALLFGAILLAPAAAMAQSPADFFADRQLTLLIGGGGGGSVDIYGRLVGRYIAKKLSPTATVVPRNLPISGGVQAFMTLGSTAPRDGSAFATSARGPLSDPLLAGKPATYDPRSFLWIGSINEDMSVCFTHKDSRVKTLEDAKQVEATMASTGALAESSKFPLMVNALAGTKLKIITGYKGASDTRLAVERGEVDGQCTTFGSVLATQPHVLKGQDYNLLIQIGDRSHPMGGKTPVITQFVGNADDRLLLDLIVKPLLITSSYALPPGVPADRVAAWRAALQQVIKDQQFLEEAAKVGLEIDYRTGEEVQALVEALYQTPKPIIDRARQVFGYGSANR